MLSKLMLCRQRLIEFVPNSSILTPCPLVVFAYFKRYPFPLRITGKLSRETVLIEIRGKHGRVRGQ